MKLVITGYAEHGKGTVCSILSEKPYHWKSMSSSMLANELFIFDRLKDIYAYKTPQECFNDRRNKRDIWYNMIREFNTPDKVRLARILLSSYDIYDGVRCIEEFNAMKENGLYDYSIWVDASFRKPVESSSSMTVRKEHCDFIIDNNGDIKQLKQNISSLCNHTLRSGF